MSVEGSAAVLLPFPPTSDARVVSSEDCVSLFASRSSVMGRGLMCRRFRRYSPLDVATIYDLFSGFEMTTPDS